MRRMMRYVALTAGILLVGTWTATHGQSEGRTGIGVAASLAPQGRVIAVPTVSVPTVSVPTVSVPTVSVPPVSVTAASTDPCTLPAPLPTQSIYTSGPPGLPGYFDSTFGSGGKVIGPRGSNSGSRQNAVAIDRANRIIVVGRQTPCGSNKTGEMIAVRYLPDGTPDASFGGNPNGLVSIAFGGGNGGANWVVVQADDKIVIGGWGVQKGNVNLPVIVRLSQSGTLDSTFGTNGRLYLTLLGTRESGYITSLALQPAGSGEKIVATLEPHSSYRHFVIRLNPNGSFDGSFNKTGYWLLNAQGEHFEAVRIQSVAGSPRIVVPGFARDNQGHSIGAVWRLTDSGALDTSFGGGTGLVRTSFHDEDGGLMHSDEFHRVAIDDAGRIVAVGVKSYLLVPDDWSTSRAQSVLARYDISGNPDPSFGSDGLGRVFVPLLGTLTEERGHAVDVQGDGRIIVSGKARDAYAGDLAVVRRLNEDGSIDTSFGNAGSNMDAIAMPSNTLISAGMAVQTDGSIVWAGAIITMPGSPQISYIVLARYWQ